MTSCWKEMMRAPRWKTVLGSTGGKVRGCGERKYMVVYSMRSEIPMAVMRREIFELCRRGLYASDADGRHGAEERREEAEAELGGDEESHVGAEHVDVAVSEVDEAHDAVDHGVAEGDERVDAAERYAVDDLLDELRDHAAVQDMSPFLSKKSHGEGGASPRKRAGMEAGASRDRKELSRR